MNLDVSASPQDAIDHLCDRIVSASPRSLVLTGGTTAGAAYAQLASANWRDRMDWSAVTLYFGDERRVPPEDEGSCYRLAAETLGQMGASARSALPALVVALNDNEEQVRAAATNALRQIDVEARRQ